MLSLLGVESVIGAHEEMSNSVTLKDSYEFHKKNIYIKLFRQTIVPRLVLTMIKTQTLFLIMQTQESGHALRSTFCLLKTCLNLLQVHQYEGPVEIYKFFKDSDHTRLQ